jgi:hypothetical protein
LRMRWVAWVGVATAIGVLATGGHWFWTMYQHFGNPLFPQFNGLFQSELAASLTVLDDRWGPRGVMQTLLWPFILVLQPWKFGETWMIPLALAASYVALLSWGPVAACRAWRGQPRAAEPVQGRDSALAALVWFVAVAYVAWLEVFAIGRYIVVLDLLAPALLATLCWRLRGARAVPRLLWVVLAFFSAVSLLNLKTWGKADWADAAYAVELPPIASPEKTAVLMVGNQPQSWKAQHFPPGTVFAGFGGNFPGSAAWNAELRRWLDRREHVVAVIQLPEAVSTKQVSGPYLFNAAARAIAAIPLLATEGRCGVARALVARMFFKSGLQAQAERDGDVVRCRLSLPAQPTLSDQALAHAKQKAMADASGLLAAHDLRLDRLSCAVRAAFIGSVLFPYVACAVERLGSPGN